MLGLVLSALAVALGLFGPNPAELPACPAMALGAAGLSEASYWTVRVGGRMAENAMWGYLDPLAGREDIRGYRAFYGKRVDAWYVDDQQVSAP